MMEFVKQSINQHRLFFICGICRVRTQQCQSQMRVREFCGNPTETNARDAKKVSDSFATHVRFHAAHDMEDMVDKLRNNVVVSPDFVSETEEISLLNEVYPVLKRLRYEDSHWDDAIHTYRETEKATWTPANKIVINRIRENFFPTEAQHLSSVHVLDLAQKGYIKPHIDSVRYCGDRVAGLSLLSDSVMRLVHHKHKNWIVDILLKRRSCYVLMGDARYAFTHEILADEHSFFRDQRVPRDRRISIMCRSEPSEPSA